MAAGQHNSFCNPASIPPQTPPTISVLSRGAQGKTSHVGAFEVEADVVLVGHADAAVELDGFFGYG